MAIDAIITGVDPAADEPSPEWRIARVERDIPDPVPVEKIGVLLEAVREVIETESFKDRFVGQVGVGNEFLWRLTLPPVRCRYRFKAAQAASVRLSAPAR